MKQEIMYKNWCTIDLNNLVHNYNYTKSKIKKDVICVLKADAYGHGAVKVAKALVEAGCKKFAVSSFGEALQLRESGILQDIIILGRIMPSEIAEAIKQDISFAAGTKGFVQEVIEMRPHGKKAKIHIKLNTGMNRTGFDSIHTPKFAELKEALELICENRDFFDVEGVFSHFAKAEDDAEFSRVQYARFSEGVSVIESYGFKPKIKHICNSAGAINYGALSSDAVRLGIYLYGCESSDPNYRPVMSFHSRILEIKELFPGDGVSYGLDFTAKEKMKIAIIGAGYADGVHRSLSGGKGFALCRGVLCPVVGRICMDMLMLDISGVTDAAVFDTVTFFGKDENGTSLSCEALAEKAGTVSYELLCSVSKRVPRIYI